MMHLSIAALFALASLPQAYASVVSSRGPPSSSSANGAVEGAARIIQQAFERQVVPSVSSRTQARPSSEIHNSRDLARSCLTIATFELEKTYEDDTGVNWSCTCGPVLGVGLSSNGVTSCQSNAPYCWISLKDGQEYCAKVELDAYFSDNYSLAWLFGTVFADTLYTEVRLEYFSGPWAGGNLKVKLDDYSCVDDEGEDKPCICEATFDNTKCSACNVCSIQGKAGDNYDCTNVNDKVEVSCRDKGIEQPQRYPMTESIFATTEIATMDPTLKPTTRPITFSPTKQPAPKPITFSPTMQPTLQPITESPTIQPASKPSTEDPTKQPVQKPDTESPIMLPAPKPVTEQPSTAKMVSVSPMLQPTQIPNTESPAKNSPVPKPVTDSTTDLAASASSLFTPNNSSTVTPTSNPTYSPTKASNGTAINLTSTDPTLFDLSLPIQYTYNGPGSVECMSGGVCMFEDSLTEECNLIAFIPISEIGSTDADGMASIIASDINTDTSPISILQGCEIACSDCTFLPADLPPQINGGDEPSPLDESPSSGVGGISEPDQPVPANVGSFSNVNGVNEQASFASMKHLSMTATGFILLACIAINWAV